MGLPLLLKGLEQGLGPSLGERGVPQAPWATAQLGWEPQVAVLQLPVVGSLWLPRVEREGQPELPAHNQRITPCATRALPGSDDARRKGAPLTLGTAHVMYIYVYLSPFVHFC